MLTIVLNMLTELKLTKITLVSIVLLSVLSLITERTTLTNVYLNALHLILEVYLAIIKVEYVWFYMTVIQ